MNYFSRWPITLLSYFQSQQLLIDKPSLEKVNLTSDWLIQTILVSDWLIDICEAVVSKFSELKDRNFLNLSNPKYSGKMEVLTTLLNVIEDERGKVLLFSHSTQLLNIIETFAQSKGYCYCRLDGNI